MNQKLFVIFSLFMFIGTAKAQLPCPYEYPDTPVNQARGVVGCTLQCDQKISCPGQQKEKSGEKTSESGTCPEGKHWNPEMKSCRSCPSGTSWDPKRMRCFCPSGQFTDNKNKRCVSCPQHWSWNKETQACSCVSNIKSMWAGKSCLNQRPLCSNGAAWDPANKYCVGKESDKPKASLEIEFAAQYEDLRGRSFATLDCHGRGVEICFAALASGDADARVVRLYDVQRTDSSPEWQYLLDAKVVEAVELREDGFRGN